MREQLVLALSCLCFAHVGCGLERIGVVPGPARDGGVRLDAAVIDAAPDAGTPDLRDAGPPAIDAGPPDAGARRACEGEPDLVACYPFDGDARDHGPRGNDLTATGVGWDPSGGIVLGPASSVFVTHSDALVHRETTLLAWVRVDTLPPAGRAGILDRDGQYGLFVHPGGELRCANNIAGGATAAAAGVIEAGRWHHVGCVADGPTLRLYVDGAEVAIAAAATTRTPGVSGLWIGENGPIGDDQLLGAIDDLRIWDAVWGAAQVAADAQRGR